MASFKLRDSPRTSFPDSSIRTTTTSRCPACMVRRSRSPSSTRFASPDCPIIAQEFHIADNLLGNDASRVELVAIDINPRYITSDYLLAFDRKEGLNHLSNWDYLTGSLPQLTTIWNAFGEQSAYAPGGAMIAHSDVAYVIDPTGHTTSHLEQRPGASDRGDGLLVFRHAGRRAAKARFGHDQREPVGWVGPPPSQSVGEGVGLFGLQCN